MRGPAGVVLEGEAGIGKTVLWRAALDRARALGLRVLDARPTEAERELSFVALTDLLADVRDEIGRLPAPQRRALRVALLLEELRGAPPNERAVATALSSLLASIAEGGPVVVAIDDVQWLDEPTGSALRFALRRTPVALVLTRRAGSVGAELRDEDVLDVSPLGIEELDDLLRMHLGTSFLRPTLLEIERASGGNPFFALELARTLLALPNPPRPLEPLPVPDGLRGLVGARLDRLTPQARATALLAAAAVRPTPSLLERAGGDAVDELIAAGVLVQDSGTIRFAHPLLAATAYSSGSAAERTAAHRSLASVATDPEERGHHLAAATETPDAEVAAAVDAASAHARARGATAAAARLAAQAVELTPRGNRAELHGRRLAEADAWVAAGAPERARSVLVSALEDACGRERGELFYSIAFVAANLQGAAGYALESADAGLAALAPEDADLRAQLELTRSVAYRRLNRYHEADASVRAAVDAAEAVADPFLLSRALSAQFYSAFEFGLGDDLPVVHRAIELFDAQPASEQRKYTGHLWAHEHYANYLSLTYRTADAREIYLRLAERARLLGDADEAYYLSMLGWNEFLACEYDAAARYAKETVHLSLQTGRIFSVDGLQLMAWLQAYRGAYDDALETVEEMRPLLDQLDPAQAAGCIADAVTVVAFARGDVRATLESFAGVDSNRPMKDPSLRPFTTWYAEALVALGRLDEAKALLDPYEEQSRTLDRPVNLACALRSRALLRAAERDYSTAEVTFEEAFAQHDRLEVPFERARTLLAHGSMLRARRKRGRARPLLADALAIFDSLGCSGWAERTQVELSQLGGRQSQTGSLTPTESRVAELVARGRSNTEVANELLVSPKTVEWNLSKIYKKLGVRSRAELAAKLSRSARR